MTEMNEVYRRVRKHPSYFKEDGSISSAVFRDSKGVSVSVDGNRSLNDIIKREEELHNYYNKEHLLENPEGLYKLIALLSVSHEICNEKEIMIELDPVDINPYHAILRRDESEVKLTAAQCKHLARNATVVKNYDNI